MIRRLLAILERIPVFKLLLPVYIVLLIGFILLVRHGHMQLLEPAGPVADVQARILWGALIFAFVVGVALISTVFFVAFRYREGMRRPYAPDWGAGKRLQLAAWLVPLAAIIAISVMVWDTAHLVDPYRALSSSKQPVTIQVVALRWKWLFIYPNDHIAAVNMMEIPVGTPVSLQLTADAPMNSFWVPRLSGQVYAMNGMVTELHLEADKQGSYAGSPAELSGDDFAGMDFTVKAVSASAYSSWKASARQSSRVLDFAAYTQLARPSGNAPVRTYAAPGANLFTDVVMQYMMPGANVSALVNKGVAQ
ncbi:MAG TPA: COX aromatic rich motif-containing protein [Candidatus Saccharimonadales bacterium]|nr:COX aromatic rich motif-containing protein [Candidatus Saccharimonadales bacterium]